MDELKFYLGIKTQVEFEHTEMRKKHIPGRSRCPTRSSVFLELKMQTNQPKKTAIIKFGPNCKRCWLSMLGVQDLIRKFLRQGRNYSFRKIKSVIFICIYIFIYILIYIWQIVYMYVYTYIHIYKTDLIFLKGYLCVYIYLH